MEISRSFLSKFKVVLLDMNSTFMFGEDRFHEGEDFYATYQSHGGHRLSKVDVEAAIRSCYEGMAVEYIDPTKIDNFPSLTEGFLKYARVDHEEIPILETVFAHHERGQVPESHAAFLRSLQRTHRLGVISNIWARKDSWLEEFKRSGISDIWDTVIFSSDSRSMKPSHRLFRQAMNAFDASPEEVVFIGDNIRVDVEPAKSFGLATVWINNRGDVHPLADLVVTSLLELA